MLWLSSLAFAVLGCSGLLSDEVVVALNEDDFVAGDSSSAEDGVRQRVFSRMNLSARSLRFRSAS